MVLFVASPRPPRLGLRFPGGAGCLASVPARPASPPLAWRCAAFVFRSRPWAPLSPLRGQTQRKPGGRRTAGSGTGRKQGTGRRRPTATERETGGPAAGSWKARERAAGDWHDRRGVDPSVFLRQLAGVGANHAPGPQPLVETETADRLDAAAASRGSTASELLRDAVETYLRPSRISSLAINLDDKRAKSFMQPLRP
jgi:Ribbon-helix-helix protein, copG family